MREPAQTILVSLDLVDAERLSVFRVALDNILRLRSVELTYAQIVDGLPLRDVYLESHSPLPSILAEHSSLRDGALRRVREARRALDIKKRNVCVFIANAGLPRYDEHR